MQIFHTVMEVFYFIFTIAIIGFIGWNVLKEKQVANKIMGGLALLMFVMRILLIR